MLRTIKASLDKRYKNKFGVIGVVVGNLVLNWVHVVVRSGTQIIESEGSLTLDGGEECLNKALSEVYSYAESTRALVFIASDLDISKCMTLSFDQLPTKKKDLPPYIKWMFQKQYLGMPNADRMKTDDFVISDPIYHSGKRYVAVAVLSDIERTIIASADCCPYLQRISPLMTHFSLSTLFPDESEPVLGKCCFLLYVTQTYWLYIVSCNGKRIYARSQAWLSNRVDAFECHVEDICNIQQEFGIDSSRMIFVTDTGADVSDSDSDSKLKELFPPENILSRSNILSKFGASSKISVAPLLVATSALYEFEI